MDLLTNLSTYQLASASGLVLVMVGSWLVAIELVIRFKGYAFKVINMTCDGSADTEKTANFKKWELRRARWMWFGLALITIGSLLQIYATVYNNDEGHAYAGLFMWSFDAITSINWLEVIKVLAPAVTAFIAFLALKNWKRQDKAKREAEFLDALIEAAHTYIAEMPRLVMLLQSSKIGMASYAPSWEKGEADKAVQGAISYIEKNGEHDGKRLLEALGAVQPSAIKLRSLTAKGQVFKFKGYKECQNSVEMLAWHFDRIEAFMAFIGTTSQYWENPEVLRQLKNMMAIDPDEIRQSIKDNNVALLKFVSAAYQRIYD